MTKGQRKGGRQKGTPNKITKDLRAAVERANHDEPLPVTLVRWAHEAKGSGNLPVAVKAMHDAAQFAYPKLKAIEHSASDAEAVLRNVETMSDEELAAALAAEEEDGSADG